MRTAVIADPVKVLFALVDVARVWFCAAVIHLLTRRESAGINKCAGYQYTKLSIFLIPLPILNSLLKKLL